MDDKPACVYQCIQPATVPTHLKRIRVMGAVVLNRDPCGRPSQVHTCDELAVLSYFVLGNGGRQTSLDESDAEA